MLYKQLCGRQQGQAKRELERSEMSMFSLVWEAQQDRLIIAANIGRGFASANAPVREREL